MPEMILIADDQPAQLRIVEEAVSRRLRYRCVTASSNWEAVTWVTSGRQPSPDLVLLGMAGPEPDAVAVIRALRACRSHLPIIVLLRFPEWRAVDQIIEAGADDFLNRPVPLPRLRVTIANALELRRLAARAQELDGRTFSLPPAPSAGGHPVSAGGEVLPLLDEQGRVKTLQRIEEEAIHFVLNRSHGCMTQAARSLGIGRSTLYRRIKDLAINETLPYECSAESAVSVAVPEPVE